MSYHKFRFLQFCAALPVFAICFSAPGCNKGNKEKPLDPSVPELAKRTIIIDKTVKYQTIDGFGFFGAADVWWASQGLWNEAWGDKVINDLGITIWRNEWVPPAAPGDSQDADWNKQKPVVG